MNLEFKRQMQSTLMEAIRVAMPVRVDSITSPPRSTGVSRPEPAAECPVGIVPDLTALIRVRDAQLKIPKLVKGELQSWMQEMAVQCQIAWVGIQRCKGL